MPGQVEYPSGSDAPFSETTPRTLQYCLLTIGDLPMTWRSHDDLHTLVRHSLAGDQTAMLALVERFRGPVFGLCYRMLGQRQDAEDAAQETFVRLLKNLHRWDSTRDFLPWLLAIAGNRCRTALSSRRRRPIAEPMVELVADDTPDRRPADQLAEEVRLALAGLRPEYSQAFVLFHDQELSYSEIAQAMDVPLGTIKTWVHRARRELIDQLRRRGAIPDSSPHRPPHPHLALATSHQH